MIFFTQTKSSTRKGVATPAENRLPRDCATARRRANQSSDAPLESPPGRQTNVNSFLRTSASTERDSRAPMPTIGRARGSRMELTFGYTPLHNVRCAVLLDGVVIECSSRRVRRTPHEWSNAQDIMRSAMSHGVRDAEAKRVLTAGARVRFRFHYEWRVPRPDVRMRARTYRFRFARELPARVRCDDAALVSIFWNCSLCSVLQPLICGKVCSLRVGRSSFASSAMERWTASKRFGFIG